MHRVPILAALLLTACASTPVPSADPHAALTGQGAWHLVAATDSAGHDVSSLLVGQSHYRLQFVDSRLTIYGGCNQLFGGFRIDGGTLHVQDLAGTRMACDAPRMQADTALSSLLEQPLAIAFMGDPRLPTQMQLKTRNGTTLRFDAIPLE